MSSTAEIRNDDLATAENNSRIKLQQMQAVVGNTALCARLRVLFRNCMVITSYWSKSHTCPH